jgi:DNA-binding XRE family transcriptional regulator
MTKIQFIERNGKREYAVVPMDIYERLVSTAEDKEDIALYEAAKAADDGIRIPAEVVNAIVDGAHPIKAWRKYRQLTIQALADKAGISKAFLSQIEGGKRTGTIKVLSALARALDVPVDLLRNESGQ